MKEKREVKRKDDREEKKRDIRHKKEKKKKGAVALKLLYTIYCSIYS